MSLQNYKELGIKHFYNHDFKTAKIYFSLAYEKRKNKKLLHFITLCDLASIMLQESMVLFEFYIKYFYSPTIYNDFDNILTLTEFRKIEQEKEDDDIPGLNYKDFLESEKGVGFKKSFESVIFSNKLVISSKDDFVDFLEKLLENGYKDLTLNYIESISTQFFDNKKFQKLAERLKEWK